MEAPSLTDSMTPSEQTKFAAYCQANNGLVSASFDAEVSIKQLTKDFNLLSLKWTAIAALFQGVVCDIPETDPRWSIEYVKVLRLLANDRTRNLSLEQLDAIDSMCYHCNNHRPGEFFDCMITEGERTTGRSAATSVLECEKLVWRE